MTFSRHRRPSRFCGTPSFYGRLMPSVGRPASPQHFERRLRRTRLLASVPWPCLWRVGSFLCRSRWGRRLILRRRPQLGRQLNFSRRLFAALGLPPDRVDREVTQLFQNILFQHVLLARLATLSPRAGARQFEVSGWDHLEAERAAGRPVILGGSHFGVNRLFSLWLARRGVKVLSLVHEDQLHLMGTHRPRSATPGPRHGSAARAACRRGSRRPTA